MKRETPYIGTLSHRIEIYLPQVGAHSTTGETAKADTLIGGIWSAMQDSGGSETEDDKVFYLSNRIYTIRFVDLIWTKGEQMYIKDSDGDYQIYSIEIIGKKQFLKLKTNKRE